MLCNITSIDNDKLVCVPPKDSSGKHKVIVHIGGYSKDIGYLQFESPSPTVLIVAVVIVVLLIVIVIVIVYCHRANKNSKTVRKLQYQLDMMEAKVAKECKEGIELPKFLKSNVPIKPNPMW